MVLLLAGAVSARAVVSGSDISQHETPRFQPSMLRGLSCSSESIVGRGDLDSPGTRLRQDGNVEYKA